jgi:probable HAF family extracellular repeat protein
MKTFTQIAVILLFITQWAGTAAGITYEVTDIGMLPGYTFGSAAYGINDNGQVVGVSADSGLSPNGVPFLYDHGNMTQVGGPNCVAHDINSDKTIVGMMSVGQGQDRAFSYHNGAFTNLTPNLTGYVYSEANAINTTGQIVGISDGFAFLYDNGNLLNIGTLPGSYGSRADDINDEGLIAGSAYYASGADRVSHAFLYNNNNNQKFTDLSAFHGAQSDAIAVNAQGEVLVKWFTSFNELGSFVYDSRTGTITDLSASSVNDINDSGQIIGSMVVSGDSRAMLYCGGVATDLNLLVSSNAGLTLVSADAINNKGQIVGYGVDATGKQHAFLATPVPEPSSIALLMVAVVSLLAVRKRTLK